MNVEIIMIVGIAFLVLEGPTFFHNLSEKENWIFNMVYIFMVSLVFLTAMISGPINRNMDDVIVYQKTTISQELKTSIESESLKNIIENVNDLIDFKGLSVDYKITDVTETIKELSVRLEGSKFKIFKVSRYEQYIVDMETKTMELK